MPIFQCQTCDYFTTCAEEARLHNEKDRNHYFKQEGVHTCRDCKIQQAFNEA